MRLDLRASNIARRAITAIAATAVAFAMLGTGALAAAPVVHDHISSSSAAATNTFCAGTICTATSVFVIVDSSGAHRRHVSISPAMTASRSSCSGMRRAARPWLRPDSRSTPRLSRMLRSRRSTSRSSHSPAGRAAACPREPHAWRRSAPLTPASATPTPSERTASPRSAAARCTSSEGSSRDATATLTVGTESLSGVGSLFTSTQMIKVLCH